MKRTGGCFSDDFCERVDPGRRLGTGRSGRHRNAALVRASVLAAGRRSRGGTVGGVVGVAGVLGGSASALPQLRGRAAASVLSLSE